MAVITATGYSYSPIMAGYSRDVFTSLGRTSFYSDNLYSQTGSDIKPIFLNDAFTTATINIRDYPMRPFWRKDRRIIG